MTHQSISIFNPVHTEEFIEKFASKFAPAHLKSTILPIRALPRDISQRNHGAIYKARGCLIIWNGHDKTFHSVLSNPRDRDTEFHFDMTKSPGADIEGIRRPFYNHIVEFILDDFGMSRFAPIDSFCDREGIGKSVIKSRCTKEEDLIAGSYYFIDKKETTAFQCVEACENGKIVKKLKIGEDKYSSSNLNSARTWLKSHFYKNYLEHMILSSQRGEDSQVRSKDTSILSSFIHNVLKSVW